MKLKTPEFKKNKIEQGKNYRRVKKEPTSVLYMDIGDVNILNVFDVKNIFEKIDKAHSAFPNHEIRVLSGNLGRII